MDMCAAACVANIAMAARDREVDVESMMRTSRIRPREKARRGVKAKGGGSPDYCKRSSLDKSGLWGGEKDAKESWGTLDSSGERGEGGREDKATPPSGQSPLRSATNSFAPGAGPSRQRGHRERPAQCVRLCWNC